MDILQGPSVGRRTGRLRAALFVLLITAAGAAAPSPATAVRNFYTTYLKHRSGGLPDGRELERLRPMVSARLYDSIVAALRYQDSYKKKNPDDKPPFVDGDYFSSLFEGPSSFTIGETTKDGVRVHFAYEDARWTDTVVVLEEHGRYVVDDVIFSGVGEFNPPGRLSERLQARDAEETPHAPQEHEASSAFAMAPAVSHASGNFVPLEPFEGDVQILSGDPDKPGEPFVMRINELPGTKIPVHSHPVDENITVLQGTWSFALGDEWDRDALTDLHPGDYAFAPKGSSMFGYCENGAVVQVHGIGPFNINWKHGAKTLDDADAAETFDFKRGEHVKTPRGSGIIRQGYASGDIIQYEIDPGNGKRFMADQDDVEREDVTDRPRSE